MANSMVLVFVVVLEANLGSLIEKFIKSVL